jgi:two-component system, sensor histidine kinase and response regulator
VIIEAQSPHIDAFGLVCRLRQKPATQDLKVIVVTNTAISEDHKRYLAIEANECLSKPVRPDDLLQRVIRLTAEVELEG